MAASATDAYRATMIVRADVESIEDRPPRIRWGVVVAVFAVAFVARFAYFYLDDLTRRMPGTFVERLLEEGTANLGSLVFFPVAVLAERYFPMDRERWRRNWLAHLLGFVVYSVAHTTFIAVSRSVVFPLFGRGTYDYGILSTRYFMESAQDLFSYTGFIAVLTLIRVQQRLREREIRAARLERDAAQARLEALTLRLQPHFLFNALNTIASTVYDDPAAADDLIGQLGDLLRQTLRTSDRQEISVAEELDLLRAYEALIEARFGERVVFEHSISSDALSLALPAFILQPLVENAVIHGTDSELSETHIEVTATVDRGLLCVAVENTTSTTQSEPTRYGTGLGATVARLQLLYGDAASLETSATSDRFRVTVKVPARAIEAVADHDERAIARAHR